MQPWHEAHGAQPIVAGQWIRPEHYGDPAAEVRNVRRNVGIIDVTPLGKLDLRGPDVPKLLNFLYVNKWSKLDVGSVRYGVMCGEDGVVIDDGVTGHLGLGPLLHVDDELRGSRRPRVDRELAPDDLPVVAGSCHFRPLRLCQHQHRRPPLP